MTTDAPQFWRKCNSCKKPISFTTKYWVCNVSTCNRKRTGLVFCTVSCWDAHLPLMNHRESWAEERKSPTAEAWAKILAGEEEETPSKKGPAQAPKNEAQAKASPSPPPSAAVSSEPKVILRRPRPSSE